MVDPLVPLSFGTVFRDRAGVERMLRERAAEVGPRLDALRGKAEWIAVVRRDETAACAALESESEPLRALRAAIGAATSRLVKGSTGGPDAAARARSKTHTLATARDAAGATLATVRLQGINPYDFTAGMLAWGALRAAAGELRGVGALGPADGFGLDELVAGAQQAGLEQKAG